MHCRVNTGGVLADLQGSDYAQYALILKFTGLAFSIVGLVIKDEINHTSGQITNCIVLYIC